jgi:P27 family predicted phage terminase small subunit
MKGRKPKPTDQKRLAGNPGKRKLNDAEPEPELTIPACPEWLDGLGRKEWSRITTHLHAVGCIAELYLLPLAAYCMAYSRWLRAEAQAIATGGDVCVSNEGGKYFNPWRAVADKAQAQMTTLAAEFGMTPSSKSRIKAFKGGPKQSALKLFAAERGA